VAETSTVLVCGSAVASTVAAGTLNAGDALVVTTPAAGIVGVAIEFSGEQALGGS